MKFGKFAGLVLALGMLCGVAAQAQVGVYGMYTATRFSGVTCTDLLGKCSSPNGVVSPSGGFGGVYYDFKKFGPVLLGADVRGGILHANKSAADAAGGDNIVKANSVLGGVRGSIRTPVKWLVPYAQVSAGWTRSTVTEPCTLVSNLCTGRPYDNFLQYEFFVGADIKIFSIMDLRPIELGAGNMNRIGTGTGAGSIGVLSVGGGIVFHMPTP